MFRNVLLSFSGVYNLLQNGLTKDEPGFYRQYINVPEGAKVLDIGCGPARVLGRMPESVEYHGFDPSEAYIKAAAGKYGRRRAFFKCATAGEETLGSEHVGTFDMVLALGVMHHIDDGEALKLLRLAESALRDEGVLVTVDVCFVPGQNPVARFLARMDRGKHVRAPEGYRLLAEDVFGGRVEAFQRDDLLRLPYNHIIMRMTKRGYALPVAGRPPRI
jgi:SAM-dependent methyltransferase